MNNKTILTAAGREGTAAVAAGLLAPILTLLPAGGLRTLNNALAER